MPARRIYYASKEVPVVMLGLGLVIVLLGFTVDMEGNGAGIQLYLILPLLLITPPVIWQRLRRPVLTIGKDALHINPATEKREEHIIPFSKIASISIQEVSVESLKVYEYEGVEDDVAYAIIVEANDGRQVPALPLDLLKRRHRKEVEAKVQEISRMIEAGAFAQSDSPPPTGSPEASLLNIRPGESREELLAAFASHGIEEHQGNEGIEITIADVKLDDINGYLCAEFDSEDKMHAMSWNVEPGELITEAVIWKIIDRLEQIYGQSIGSNGLIWRRNDNGILRELRTRWQVLDQSYALCYSERVAVQRIC